MKDSDSRRVQPIAKNASLAAIAYEAIRQAIITGRIKPGERMGQVELARELGVSERTVREAFAKLVAKGLAVHEPYKGVRVAALPLSELREVYAMRALLEGHAMDLAAARITAEELAEMRALLPRTQSGSTLESVLCAQEANHQFHWVAIHACGSNILCRTLEQLWELMFAYDLLYQEPDEAISREDYAQHAEILAALGARDGERAARANTVHIQKTAEMFLARLKEE